jgi:AcrR family transcriptional regulator
VYRYFGSKEQIIEGMSRWRQQQNAERLQRAIGKGTTLERFNELLQAFFIDREQEELAANCALIVELAAESQRNQDVRAAQSQTLAAVWEALAELIREAQARGEVKRSLDPDSVARLMIGIYQGFVVQRLIDPDMDASGYTKVAQSLFDGTFWQGDGGAKTGASAAMRH